MYLLTYCKSAVTPVGLVLFVYTWNKWRVTCCKSIKVIFFVLSWDIREEQVWGEELSWRNSHQEGTYYCLCGELTPRTGRGLSCILCERRLVLSSTANFPRGCSCSGRHWCGGGALVWRRVPGNFTLQSDLSYFQNCLFQVLLKPTSKQQSLVRAAKPTWGKSGGIGVTGWGFGAARVCSAAQTPAPSVVTVLFNLPYEWTRRYEAAAVMWSRSTAG